MRRTRRSPTGQYERHSPLLLPPTYNSQTLSEFSLTTPPPQNHLVNLARTGNAPPPRPSTTPIRSSTRRVFSTTAELKVSSHFRQTSASLSLPLGVPSLHQ